MNIKWLGHASFLITSEKAIKVLTDPYKSGGFIGYARISESPDIVTVSHQHSDHNYLDDIKGKPKVVSGAGLHRVGSLEFTGIATYHDKASGSERGENTIFCFTMDDVRICHCGDLGHALDDAAIRSLDKLDVLLIPSGGPPTLDLKDAVALIERLQPGITIPMHFRNSKCKFPKHDIDDLLKLIPGTMKTGKSEVKLTKDTLPRNQVLILEPSL